MLNKNIIIYELYLKFWIFVDESLTKNILNNSKTIIVDIIIRADNKIILNVSSINLGIKNAIKDITVKIVAVIINAFSTISFVFIDLNSGYILELERIKNSNHEKCILPKFVTLKLFDVDI